MQQPAYRVAKFYATPRAGGERTSNVLLQRDGSPLEGAFSISRRIERKAGAPLAGFEDSATCTSTSSAPRASLSVFENFPTARPLDD